MSELVLIRHGQASFGAASYDKLSDQGFEQVRLLSRHLQDRGISFDHLVSGSLQRQQETARELLPLIKGSAPVVELDPELNEYSADAVIKLYLRQHNKDEAMRDMEWPIRDVRLFQRIFDAATARWVANELEPDGEESGFERFEEFQSRVHGVTDALMKRFPRGCQVLISTSGGVIALAMQRVLGFSNPQAIATNWMVYNSSITRIRYGGGRVSLDQFNSLPHLELPHRQHLITHR
ncbi:MAG: histidine phosphatase family protein [Gammaproteobacteria bacterium]|nr:histidine phosphatase family protein [Gammaproteobacteria bacterium]